MRRLLITIAALLAVATTAHAQPLVSNPGLFASTPLVPGKCTQGTSPFSVASTPDPCSSATGSGNVVGPTSSVANDLAIWTNGTGTALGDPGIAYTDLGLLTGTQTWSGQNTFTGTLKAVSVTSYGGASSLTDAGISAPVVVTPSLNVTGTGSFTAPPTVNGQAVWYPGNFSPGNYLQTATAAATYLPVSGGTVNGALNYNAVGSVFRGLSLEWSGASLWKIGSDSAQTGSNNGGGDLDFYAYGDNGAFLGNSAVVTRATRQWSFPVSPSVPTPAVGDSSNLAADTAFVQTAAATAASAAAANAIASGTGAPAYIELPLITNAQIAAGGKVAGIILPRAASFPDGFTTSVAYADTPASGSVEFEVEWNGTPYASLSCLSGFNKCNFNIYVNPSPGPVNAAASDRIDIVYLAGVTGPLGGLHATFVGTWK